FYEMKDGTLREVPRVMGTAKAGRKRDAKDTITAGCPSIIDPDVWDDVLVKLDSKKRPRRAPKAPGLWLAPICYCARCGQRMTGWHQKAEKHPNSYTCSSYRRYGKSNKYGCRLHKARADIIERLVEKYLAETNQGLGALLDSEVDALLAPLV